MQGSIRQGTTPTIPLRVGADITEMDIYLTFECECVQITKTNGDLDISTETDSQGKVWTLIDAHLSQEETLSMPADHYLYMNIRAVTDNGDTALATEFGRLMVKPVLLKRVLGR